MIVVRPHPFVGVVLLLVDEGAEGACEPVPLPFSGEGVAVGTFFLVGIEVHELLVGVGNDLDGAGLVVEALVSRGGVEIKHVGDCSFT